MAILSRERGKVQFSLVYSLPCPFTVQFTQVSCLFRDTGHRFLVYSGFILHRCPVFSEILDTDFLCIQGSVYTGVLFFQREYWTQISCVFRVQFTQVSCLFRDTGHRFPVYSGFSLHRFHIYSWFNLSRYPVISGFSLQRSPVYSGFSGHRFHCNRHF